MKQAKKLLGVAMSAAIAMPMLAFAGGPVIKGPATRIEGAAVGVPARITKKINENDLTEISGHVRPFLSKATDKGPVNDSTPTGVLMLMFSRTPAQQADLDAFVDSLHNKKSASYHKWMTPAQFGARFEPADSDVAAVKAWLESHGFKVLDVVPSKTHIAFEGTMGQVRETFRTEVHKVVINGENHMAAVSEPQIPAALAPVVAGINKLDDFAPKPLFHKIGLFKTDTRTGKSTLVSKTVSAPYAPGFTFSNTNGTYYAIGPQDFYTIYNENALLTVATPINGAGQTIAVIEEANVAPADVTAFRSLFGLPTYPSTPNSTQGGVNYILGTSSGLTYGGNPNYSSCLTPVATGNSSGENSEADIDVQWAGVAAPAATIDFVACGGTNGGDGSTLGSLGIDRSAQYIANYLSGSVVAASLSYGECEGDMTSANMTYYNGQWEQFAAEGITAVVSSGDGGAEQCYQNDADATTLAPSVNGMGDSAYNVSAGGTDFADAYETYGYTTSPASTWWNSTNGTGNGSAKSYVPETTWGGYCSSVLFVSELQKAGNTDFGSTYTPEAVCSSTYDSSAYRAVVGGAGGISTVTSIPTWQNVYGIGQYVGGVSTATTYRNIPDVSLFASNGFWGHYLPYCDSQAYSEGTSTAYACTVVNYEAGDLGAGGTSYVAPQLAGFMALVAQKTGDRQGQADYTFYNLAAQQYGTTASPSSNIAACSGSGLAVGSLPPSTCNFQDISDDIPSLQGGTITPGNYQPCKKGDVDCYDPSSTAYGVNVVPGTTATAGVLGYTAGPGYDPTTGLGSLNISNLVNNWNKTSAGFATTTTLSASATSIVATGSVTLTSAVTATGRGGAVAPAGYVTYYLGSTSGTSLGTAPITISSTGSGSSIAFTGNATLTVPGSALKSGANTIIAVFGGDGANDASSTSPSVTVSVLSAQPVGSLDQAVDGATRSSTVLTTDLLFVNGWAADPFDGAISNVVVYIDGASIGTPTTGESRPDVASYFNNPSYANSGFSMTYAASNLSAGTHVVTAVATGSTGLTLALQQITITVKVANRAPIGNLELAVDTVTAQPTISKSTGSIWVSGWAADYQTNTVSSVQVLIDGNVVGNATLGISRPDVASYFNDPSWTNTGYQFATPASGLSTGTHKVTAVATDSLSLSTTFGPLTITVTP